MGWPNFIWQDGTGQIPRCPVCGKPLAWAEESSFFPQSVCHCARTANPGEVFAQALDIQRLPGHTSLRRNGRGWEIKCSNRSFASIYWWLFLAITVAGLYALLANGPLSRELEEAHFDYYPHLPGFAAWLFLVGPFALCGLLWRTFGRVIIQWDAQYCSVFSGCRHIGRQHQFEWDHLYEVRREIKIVGGDHFRGSRVIVLVADGTFEFGMCLADDQRALIIAMLLGKGKLLSVLADAPQE